MYQMILNLIQHIIGSRKDSSNRSQLSASEKKREMNDKYLASIQSSTYWKNILEDKDIQGHRNNLIKQVALRSISFIDLGCGLGSKAGLLLKYHNTKVKSGTLIDFSSTASEFTKKVIQDERCTALCGDALDCISSLPVSTEVNLVYAFGFLHELSPVKRQELLKTIYDIFNHDEDYLFILSDNSLYFDGNSIKNDFFNAGFDGIVYVRLISFLDHHLYVSICSNVNSSNSLPSFLVLRRRGRVDSLLGFFWNTSYSAQPSLSLSRL